MYNRPSISFRIDKSSGLNRGLNVAWFKKSHNRVGLSAQRLEELQIRLSAKLGDFGGGLPDRVLRYLIDDEDDSVLSDLAAKQDAAHALGLNCAYPGFSGVHRQGADWSEFLETIEPVEPRFYLRLGKVFEAAARTLPADRFFCQPWFDGALWLELLLQEATRIIPGVYSSAERKTAISGALVESLLAAEGRSVEPFVTSPFRAPPAKYHWDQNRMRMMVLSVANIGETFAKHRDLLAPFLTEGSAESRLMAVENLARGKTSAEPFVLELVACATCTSKQVRELAESMLKAIPQLAQPHLEQRALTGDRSSREHAVRILGRLCRDSAAEFLESLAANETSKPIQEAIANALAEVQPAAGDREEFSLVPPPRDPRPLRPPITPALRTIVEQLIAEYNAFAEEHNQRLKQAQ
ncbi:MAG: hypothetical protein C5B58_12390, partial [Acidobacteria bacterium]